MTQVVIVRAEGRINEAIKPGQAYGFDKWQHASKHLQALCNGINADRLGYDKCDFWVTFADGFVYQGRYDAANPASKCYETPHLGQHIAELLRFVARIERPAWITPAYWQRLIDTQPEDEREEAKRLLASYCPARPRGVRPLRSATL